jgi:hypothetical protein
MCLALLKSLAKFFGFAPIFSRYRKTGDQKPQRLFSANPRTLSRDPAPGTARPKKITETTAIQPNDHGSRHHFQESSLVSPDIQSYASK